MMPSRFIHVTAGVRLAFWLEAEQDSLCAWTTLRASLHPLTDLWVASTLQLCK